MIEANKIEKKFTRGAQAVSALQAISLNIASGERVSVVGPSGSGKTTLLSILSGLERPDAGDVMINQVSLKSLSERELSLFRAQKIGIVFQQFHLMPHLTALENVSLPLEILKNALHTPLAQIREAATEMLGNVGIGHRLHHLPAELSGGECQRVAIARALMTKPAYLFADEPSGNLDSHTGQQVMDLLFRLVAENNTTLVLVTHNPDLADQCDRTIRIQDGRLTAGSEVGSSA